MALTPRTYSSMNAGQQSEWVLQLEEGVKQKWDVKVSLGS